MLNVRALKAEMARYDYTQESLAKEIGMTSRTFHQRLVTGDFGVKEIEVMISVLHLEDPMSIFFADSVT